ncbi:hypothetical protein J1614_003151 [Plenodomus biglobosus]|nr:hypothetical protein J1614_003151 [Plenodomus biglobosus]
MSSYSHSTQQQSNSFASLADLGQDLPVEHEEQNETEPTSNPSTIISPPSVGIPPRPEDDQMFFEPYDLVADEEQNGSAPIFTRGLLERMTIRHLEHRSSRGEVTRVWQDDLGEEESDMLALQYVTRVEMNHGFQSRFGHFSKHIQLLRQYNDVDSAERLRTPYSFDAFRSPGQDFQNGQKDLGLLPKYRAALANTVAIGLQSDARHRCHIAVFAIVKVLETRYKELGLKYTPIDILFQDPTYKRKDQILIRELHHDMGCSTNSKVYFVSDPEGLLAVDPNTLVITAFLPFQVPLVQILVDLFAFASGPAAFLCDRMALDVHKLEYTLQDRDSPAVARFFSERYLRLDDEFPDHEVEPELKRKDADGEENTIYWLSEMDLHVRRCL